MKLSLILIVVFLLLVGLSEERSRRRSKHRHEGGLSAVDPREIKDYISFIDKQRVNHQWKKCVKRLAKVINSDPALRYHWEEGIRRSENLKGKNGKDVLDMLNTILSVGPAFNTGGLVGFPINVLFIHLMQNQNGRAIFSNSKFNRALRPVLNQYGKMLKTSVSMTFMNDQQPTGWFCPTALNKSVSYSQFKCDPSKPYYGFKNWNQWFLREFREGVRQVGTGSPNGIKEKDIIVHSCESTPITDPEQPVRGVKASDQFWLKDNKYSLAEMFGKRGLKKGYVSFFVGGTAFQAFLSAMNYHHWHSPVDGIVVDVYKIPGTYFLDHSQVLNQFDPSSPDMSLAFISATAARMVFVIKADNPKIGYVGLVYIGMAECSGVSKAKKRGDRVRKGDRIGNFVFGGSSYLMVFQKQANLTFSDQLYEVGSKGEKVGKTVHLNSFLAYVT